MTKASRTWISASEVWGGVLFGSPLVDLFGLDLNWAPSSHNSSAIRTAYLSRDTTVPYIGVTCRGLQDSSCRARASLNAINNHFLEWWLPYAALYGGMWLNQDWCHVAWPNSSALMCQWPNPPRSNLTSWPTRDAPVWAAHLVTNGRWLSGSPELSQAYWMADPHSNPLHEANRNPSCVYNREIPPQRY